MRLARRAVAVERLESRRLFDASFDFTTASQTVSNASGSVEVFVVRGDDTSGNVSVNYATAPVTAAPGVDYVHKSGSLVFGPGETLKSFFVTLIDRPYADATEDFTLSLQSPSPGAYLGATATQAVTLQNDRSPVTLASGSYAVDTDATHVDVLLTRGGNTTIPVYVDYATTDVTAVAGDDYVDTRGTLAFGAGETSKTVTVPLLGNRDAADGVQFGFALSNGADGAILIDTSAATVTIANAYSPVQFSPAGYTATTDDTSLALTVTRTGNTGLAAGVDYATADGTANSGADYLSRSGTLSFAPGETSKTIDVPILGNLEAAGDLDFTVSLSSATGAAVPGPVVSATATIENHYSPVRFASSDYTVTSDGTDATVTVSRTGNLAVAADVDYETADGTAEAGADYTSVSGTLSFGPGEATKDITVPLAGRHDAASGLHFDVLLTDTGGGAVLESAAQTTVTIDNPHAPIEFAATAYDTSTDALNVTVTVRRAGNTSGAVSVQYATVDGSAAAGTDYAAVSGTLNFAAGEVTETIVVPLLGNFASGPGSEFSLVLSSPSGAGAELGAADSAVVTIDNDHSVVQLEADSLNVDVRDGSVVIAVTRQGNLDLPASVDYATADGTAAAGEDYYAASGILAFGPGEATQYITVALLGDAGSPPSASFFVSLSSPDGNAELASPGGAIVVVENYQSMVQFDASTYTVSADAGSATLVLTRTGNTALPATVDYATADGTAVDGVDYTASGGTVSFLAGQTLKTVEVPVLVNLTGPADVTFTVTLSNPTDSVVGAAGAADVTVQNLHSVAGFESAAATFSGDDGVAGLVVRRAGNTSLAGSVHYSTFSDTAVAGEDFVAAAGVLSFAAGEVTRTLSVNLPGNPTAATDRAFRVVLSGLGDGGTVVGAADTATVTVTNIHSVVSFATTAYAAGESAGVVTVTLSRVGHLGRAISVAYATADGTATAGPDYLAAAGTVTFAEGQSTATFDLPVNPDLDFDPGETFSVSLGSPANGAVIGPASSAVVTLTDTTPPPTFSGGGLVALIKPGRVDGLSLTFDQALEEAPPATAFALYQRSGEKPGIAARLKPLTVAGATYDPAARAVTVHSLRPLRANRFYQLVVDAAAVRNQGGRQLDGAGNGQEGSPLVVTFGRGRKLSYVDGDGDTVRLSLKGPGVMQLVRGPDGNGERLTLGGTTSLTTLIGTVRPGRASGDGHTTLGVLAGLGAATNLLTAVQFDVGAFE